MAGAEQKNALVGIVVFPEKRVPVPVGVVQVHLITHSRHMPPHPAQHTIHHPPLNIPLNKQSPLGHLQPFSLV